MDPWKSWAIVAVLGAGAGYYYSQSGKLKQGRDRITSLQSEQGPRHASDSRSDGKDIRKKKGKTKASDASDRTASDVAEVSSAPTPDSSTDKVKKRKGPKQQPSKLAQSSAVDTSNERVVDLDNGDGEDEEISNKEFAKQLSGLKTGTSLKKSEPTGKENKKTGRQGKSKDLQSGAMNGTAVKPNGLVNGQNMSTASSTTGADADDDLSLPVSPDLNATQTATASGGDVSDMLEPPAKGPSVLRLVQPASSQPARQAKEKKSKPEPETKKQRQNRQKSEEKRIMVEQAEKQRRVLLEKQLRAAREAEGRPAKNGLGASTMPSANAWNKSAGSSNAATSGSCLEPLKSDASALLDTFEEDKSFLGQRTAQINGGANDTSTEDMKAWDRDFLSEEEQMKLINEMGSDDTWNTVTKGGKSKKKFTRHLEDGERPPAESSKTTSGNSAPIFSDNPIERSFNHELSPLNGTLSSGTQQDSGRRGTRDIKSNNLDADLAHTSLASGNVSTRHAASKTADSGTDKGREVEHNHHEDQSEELVYPTDSSYSKGVPPAVSKRWRAIAKNLNRDVWNYDNIQNHPDYNPAWPYALTGHPMDSDWAGDWDSDDMRKGNRKRAKEESAQKADC